MAFKKGYTPWNKGKKYKAKPLSEEHRKKLSKSHKGKTLTKEHKEKISKGGKGRKTTKESRINYSKSKKGFKHTKETREKMRASHLGKPQPWKRGSNHYNWRGGKSFEPYGLEFNNDLKEVIRNRDKRKCQICNKTELEIKRRMSVHHIDYNKQNNNPKNLISLCPKCHTKTNLKRKYWVEFFSNRWL